MTDYRIDESYRRNDAGFSSLGVESKYYKDGYWYKQDISGYEGLAEEVCSMVLRHSNIESYVEYEACTINGRSGCRSRNSVGIESIRISRCVFPFIFSLSSKSWL